jgi:integral membrane protein
MNRRATERFRLVALLEGTSFLVLLGIAMPLKYIADMPVAVRIVGMAHGFLFLLYGFLVFGFLSRADWSLMRAVKAMIWSLVPFGTFVLDQQLKQELSAPESR